jgi:hypothetical protein
MLTKLANWELAPASCDCDTEGPAPNKLNADKSTNNESVAEPEKFRGGAVSSEKLN